ncbi:predicted protein [Sclerotinia sclerotiorum 1980 UF-70]|uniref:Uncharacterized protein n=2 Tax=Sclerotinia sclerotiorum (strain ATCC 18683 / 1980 / Ss-1) TaxID=665079 RepID=A7ERJ9_SCLS1|nr:predicted protein [Sclerotinia sclerotiorum 1980 UF-70]APA13439.1 hypothetical protein sscle_11g082090 [Sclerotinia sclerotiorum 1980 UF-70]EDN92091.1 predicted protein [Sclerotinia sclerotiorum 1980 UF-70]
MSTKDTFREITTTGIDDDLSATHMFLETQLTTGGGIKIWTPKIESGTTITAGNKRGAMYASDHPVSTHGATDLGDAMYPEGTRTTVDKKRDTSSAVRFKKTTKATCKARDGSMVRMRTIDTRVSRNVEERKCEEGEMGGATDRGKEGDARKR